METLACSIYFGKSGLADVLEEIEQANSKNQESIFLDRISDDFILSELKAMGFDLDTTSKRFTIISWLERKEKEILRSSRDEAASLSKRFKNRRVLGLI